MITKELALFIFAGGVCIAGGLTLLFRLWIQHQDKKLREFFEQWEEYRR